MANIAVIGAGPMGLATAYHLGKQGHAVTVYEKDSIVGGMTASFDFDGLKIERYYHFICGSDDPYFDLLDELGLKETLRWVDTRMGYFHEGKVKAWGDPIALLKFPGLSLAAKIRYGLTAFLATKRKNWQPLDGIDAISWLKKGIGQEGYDILWKPLFELKFYQFTNNLSAAWVWSRMRRVGLSRRNLMQEQMGFLDGGSDTLLDGLSAAITAQGGNIKTSCAVNTIGFDGTQANSVETEQGRFQHDIVVSTVPLPYIAPLLPESFTDLRAAYSGKDNIAVVCVLIKLSRQFSPYFWLNISDARIPMPGFIEYSNLNPLDEHVLYAPFYMPADHELYQNPNSWFVEQVRRYLQIVDPSLRDEEILSIKAGRYEHAQPICPPKYLESLPSIKPPGLDKLLIADTSYYYPEDRSISESVKLGKELAHMCETL